MDLKTVWNTIDEKFKGKAQSIGTCHYKMEDGRCCAIGIFLPDDNEDLFELDADSNDLFEKYPEYLELMPIQDKRKLELWQRFHDKLDGNKSLKDQKAALFNEFVKLTK